MRVTNTDPDYKKLIEKKGRDYKITHSKMKENDEIVCPNDADMTVTKVTDSEIILKKKCYKPDVFLKSR